MDAQLVLHFDNTDDLLRVLQFLKDSGLEKLTFKQSHFSDEQKPEKKEWAFGIGNLGGRLDYVNIRDYVYNT